MIPSSNFTDPPVVAAFLPPNDEQYYNLKQTVLGGIALDNPASGRGYQRWQVYYQQGTIYVKPQTGSVVFSLGVAKVLTVGLAFDASMKMVLTWTTLTGAFLYYFDIDLNDYVTKSYPGVSSSRVSPDNIESFYAEQTDVIFAYTLNGNLYYRQQREKYDVEHLIAPCEYALIKLGQSTEGRLQFQLVSPADMLGAGEIDDVPITVAGPPPVIFVYTITPNVFAVNEGGSVVFNITTTHMPNGTILKYANSAGDALESDFVGGCVGEVIVNNNTAQFTLNVKEDIATEDFETLVMSIYTESNVWLSSSHPIIINDTSVSLISKFPVKLTTLAYTLIQPTIATFPARLISRGYTLVQPAIFQFPVKFKVGGNTLIQPAIAYFPAKVFVSNRALIQPNIFQFPVKLTISAKTIIQPAIAYFPVQAAVYSIIVTPNKLTINEGEEITFNVTTSSINNGTSMNYYIGSGTANNSDFLSDPYSSQVTLLLEFEGTVGSNTFVDSSFYNNQIFAYGDAQISSLQSKSGSSSLALDGNNDYIQILSNMNVDSGDFTIDGFIYINSLTNPFFVFDSRQAPVVNGLVLYITTTASINAFYVDAVAGLVTAPASANGTVSIGQWHHVALVKQNNSHRIYLNGNLVASINAATNYSFTNPSARIGYGIDNESRFSGNGYVDKLRVTKGVARYNANFNPTALTGNFVINNNAGSFKITAVNDMLTEGTENFVMNVANSALTSRVGYSPSITINDTSKATTYLLTASSTTMTENETVAFTLTTTNVPDNTVLNYTISVGNVGSSDFSSVIQGQVTVIGDTASFNMTTVQDLTSEGTEIFVMSVYKTYGAWLASSPSISITDSSMTPTLTPTSSPIARTVTVTTDKTNVSEGGSVTYIVNSTGYISGATLTWQILSSSTNYLDFSSGVTSGTVTLTNNYGSFSVNISTDANSEAPESYYVSLFGSDNILVANSPTVTIYDINVPTNTPGPTPSFTPAPATPTYSVIASTTNVSEGSRINFTVNTTNVINGTQFYFQTYGNSAGLGTYDITYGSSTANGAGNNFIINNNTSTFWVDVNNDSVTEGTESFGASIHSMQVWIDAGSIPGYQTPILAQSAIITINDTSKTPTSTNAVALTPTYSLTVNRTSMNEGDNVIYYLNTTNVPNGTVVYWGSDYGLSPAYNTVTGTDFGYPDNLSIVATAGVTALTINNNTVSFSLTAANDLTTENIETLAMTIRSSVPDGALLARAPLVTINDTSKAPLPTYSLAVNKTTINEGETITFTVNSTNVPDGTLIQWGRDVGLSPSYNTATPVDFGIYDPSSSLSFGLMTVITVNNNTATFNLVASNDYSTESLETLAIVIKDRSGGSFWTSELLARAPLVTINDTSITPTNTTAPTYSLNPNTLNVGTDGSVTFTISTTNVPNGTVLWWQSDDGLSPFYNSTYTLYTQNNSFGTRLNIGEAITINNNTAQFTLYLVDYTTNTEVAAMTIRTLQGGALLARAPLVNVTNIYVQP